MWKDRTVAIKKITNEMAVKKGIDNLVHEARIMSKIPKDKHLSHFRGVTLPPDPVCLVIMVHIPFYTEGD